MNNLKTNKLFQIISMSILIAIVVVTAHKKYYNDAVSLTNNEQTVLGDLSAEDMATLQYYAADESPKITLCAVYFKQRRTIDL